MTPVTTILGQIFGNVARVGVIVPLEIVLILGFFINTFDYKYSMTVPDEGSSVDFIVVGSGSGGSAVAGRLSEVSTWDVLMLEAGPAPSPIVYVPAIPSHFAVAATDLEWHYNVAQQAEGIAVAMKNRSQPYGRARTLGGTGTINAMTVLRGNAKDYDRWAELGNTGWGYDDVLPYFMKSESFDGPTDSETASYRGFNGPMPVTQKKEASDFQKVLFEAAEELGYSVTDSNAKNQIGIGGTQYHLKDGQRVSSADAYIRPHLESRSNLKVLGEAHVTKILLDDSNKAIGVEYEYKNNRRTVFARKEVIISAGAIESPKLLMLSGIGPRDELEKHQIPIKVEVPGVGENLQDHVGIFGGLTFFKGNLGGTNIANILNPLSILQYIATKTGTWAWVPGLEAEFLLNVGGDDPEWADLQVQLLSASVPLFDFGFVIYDIMGYSEEFFSSYFGDIAFAQAFNMNPSIVRTHSLGKISLSSTDPKEHPIIDPRILSDERDLYLAANATKFLVMQYGKTNAFQNQGVTFHDKPVPGCTDIEQNSDEYFQCVAKTMAYIYLHIVGTCKMAPDSDPVGVVDERLRVRGVSNLRVIDASIMPKIVSSNTHAPVVMIAEKGADLIKEDWNIPI